MEKYDIVIRCKNEIKWLPRLFASIDNQTRLPNRRIFVDNNSNDGSLECALQNHCEVVSYPSGEPYNYSKALNLGIEKTSSAYVLLISAHCILFSSDSLERLIRPLREKSVAGVYGRQIPTPFSNAVDTRDLLTVFGREQIIFRQYPFFHNAFSIIRRSVWNDIRFDEDINGIEDRIWARQVCRAGHSIAYEPSACVFHEHGLNQGLDQDRAIRVCKMLSVLHEDDLFEYPKHLM